ncbi:MAG: alpha/beta hydrolase [Chloroflexota bacterium]
MARPSRYIVLFIALLFVTVVSAQTSTLRESNCRFNIPENITLDCYTLRVPENRQDSNSKDILLSIAIVRHPSGNPEPDPIMFLQGGPGGSTLSTFDLTYASRFEPLLATNRDIILFDQRGTGKSSPRLDCGVYNVLQVNLLDFEFDGQSLSRDDVEQRLNQSLVTCGERLASVHDLDGYNTRENAADIEAIRLALGYEQVNLWGISYGTKLALTAMRDYPDSFRRVVLDSAYPLEANLYTELPQNFDRALHVLFDDCRDDMACNQTYPELETVLFGVIERLNERAIRFDAPNPYTNQVYEDVILDGNLLLRSIFQLLYSTDILPRLPQLIYEADANNFESWLVLIGWLTAQRDAISTGMNYAVQCQEEFAFTEAGSIREAWSAFPNFDEYSQYIDFTADLDPICNVFNQVDSPEIANFAVASDIPTLIIAGEYDPITPPRWGEMVANQLTNSLYLEFEAHGHGPTSSQGCAQSIMIDYLRLEDVDTLDTTCMNDIVLTFSGTMRGDFDIPDSASIHGTMMP